jgi:hypothetical protein
MIFWLLHQHFVQAAIALALAAYCLKKGLDEP